VLAFCGDFVDKRLRVIEIAEIGGMTETGGGTAGQLSLFNPVDAEMALAGVTDRRAPVILALPALAEFAGVLYLHGAFSAPVAGLHS
jgi:hypothetical protein